MELVSSEHSKPVVANLVSPVSPVQASGKLGRRVAQCEGVEQWGGSDWA